MVIMRVSEFNANVPANIVRLMEKRGLKQGAVADWAGYSKQQFSDMLNGRRIIKACDVLAIANALDVEIGELFARTSDDAKTKGA